MNTYLMSTYRPYSCVWELTLECNLNCAHCGSDAGTHRRNELTTKECLSTVDQLANLGGANSFPYLKTRIREDWSTIAQAAIRRGITVNLLSNGTTINQDMARHC